MLHLASNIKWIRLLKGYTQVEYAEKVGASVPMIKSYEGKKAIRPNDLIMEKIARLAGISAEDLEKTNLKERIIEVINPDTKKVEFKLAPSGPGATQHDEQLKKEIENLKALIKEKDRTIRLLERLVPKEKLLSSSSKNR